MSEPVSEPKRSRKPVYVAKVGNVRVPVLRNGKDRLVVIYRRVDGGPRIRESFVVAKRREAQARADEVARSIANSLSDVLTLSSADRDNYRLAAQALAPLGVPLHAAIEEYVAARKAIPGHTLLEAANFFSRGFIERRVCPATSVILDALLAQLRDDRRDERRYIKPLKKDLETFAKRFPDLQAVTEDLVREYLRGLVTSKAVRDRSTGELIPKGAPVGPRRRDNVRDAIVSLMRFARKKEFLPADKTSAAEHISHISEGREVTTYTPAQLTKILAHFAENDSDWLPWAAVAAFAGLRTSEILRLQWSAFNWEHQAIAVSAKVARKVKTSRQPPILPALASFLAPWRKSAGFVISRKWKDMEAAHSDALKRLVKSLSWSMWDNNALRHSFGSHRLALVKNIAQVAFEMGNSPEMVREDYNNPKSEAESVQYFALRAPESLAKIIPFAAA